MKKGTPDSHEVEKTTTTLFCNSFLLDLEPASHVITLFIERCKVKNGTTVHVMVNSVLKYCSRPNIIPKCLPWNKM